MKSQLSQLQKKQTLLRIFIFTLVTIIVWVGVTLLRTQRETGIRPELNRKAEALNPNVSAETLDQIEQKRAFSDAELSDFPIYSIVTLKTGEQQLVVFSASDKARREVTLEGSTQQPATSLPPGTSGATDQGPTSPVESTVTVEHPSSVPPDASPAPPPTDTLPPGTLP